MTNYSIKDCPHRSQWVCTHDEKAARGGIRHLMLMPSLIPNHYP